MMARQLSHLAGADIARLVLGTKVPIILTRRAVSAASRLAPIRLARMVAAPKRDAA